MDSSMCVELVTEKDTGRDTLVLLKGINEEARPIAGRQEWMESAFPAYRILEKEKIKQNTAQLVPPKITLDKRADEIDIGMPATGHTAVTDARAVAKPRGYFYLLTMWPMTAQLIAKNYSGVSGIAVPGPFTPRLPRRGFQQVSRFCV